MRRVCVLGMVAAMVINGPVRWADAAAFAPRITVEDQARKNHVVTILGANLVMVAGLGRGPVSTALMALDRHLQERLSAGQPALVYPEVVLSIVRTAVLREWSGADTAAVLASALKKIDEGHSPEMTRQKIVLAIIRNEKAPAVLAGLAVQAPVFVPVHE